MKKKYELIIGYIERLIAEKHVNQGDRLPSIRFLAEKYGCNKSTVIRAYQELELNHKIYSIPKGGFYLVEKNPGNHDEYDSIDFSEVMPDPKLLPYKEFNHCINRAVELYKDSLFSYGDAQGLKSLRKALLNHFSEHQIFTSADNIFITSGAQQALSILAKMHFPNNKRNILVEQPTYGLMQELVALNGIKLIGISRNQEGIDLNQLEMILKNEDIKFFYTIPRLHNPLGMSYSEKVKREIVQLAEKYDTYIVEDDYLADIDMDKKALPVHYYDIFQRTIYVKSFSKAFMPGIRIGAVVLHEKLRKEFSKHKRCHDLNTSVLAQGALEIFINSGMYKHHIRKAQLEYRKKMDCFRECVENLNMTEVEFKIPETGFFVWIKLSNAININILEKRLRERNIFISPADYFFIGNNRSENAFRICISKLTKDQMKTGIRIIFEEIHKLQKIKEQLF
ncbi:DNA-binding transcriptional MocR family regulator [Anaerosolibacter carboniphilus]|uniref:DNA-binding transcriptional MocR family regulator n=1 Tax=Anaerosolibacter carboniphilus TaxID=1417629 RepID=A0A841KM44_9FIRM|nr:PLP-dependent aminotransferase family protein [Anaerosolibacter carboniphilus]MBB6214473.1 DNA-binding transcriptional MocR family regulator [Anaerosolibacter carboniphilus]